MEQDGSADVNGSNAQKEFDIVLLYDEETQTQIAESVCNNIRNLGRQYGVELRVEQFGQLQLGKQALAAVDHVIIYSSIIMFFRDTVCLSDEINLFATNASINYKIQLPDRQHQSTTIPVAIEGNTKVVDKPSLMSLAGLKVTDSGMLDRTNETKLIRKLSEVLQVPLLNSWRSGQQALAAPRRSITGNGTRQATGILGIASSFETSNQSALPPCVVVDSPAPQSPEEQVETQRSVHGQEQQGSFPQAQRHDQRKQEDPAPPELRQIWNQQGARPKRSLNTSNTQSSAQTQLPADPRLPSAPRPNQGSPSPAGNTSAVAISRGEAGQRAFQADEEENRPETASWGGPNPFDEELRNAEQDLSTVSLGSSTLSSGDFSYSDAPSCGSDDATARRRTQLERPRQVVPDLVPSQARTDPADGGPLEAGDALADGGTHRPNFDLMPEDDRAELRDQLL